MKTIDRRDFLKMAGAGSVVVVAGVAMPVAGADHLYQTEFEPNLHA